jgi:ATP/maltotriose-dependent transcriptional regulator MalT
VTAVPTQQEAPASNNTSLELATQLVALLSGLAREELRLVCSSTQGAALSAISDSALLEFERILPRLIQFDQRKGRVYISSVTLRECLASALVAAAEPNGSADSTVHLIRAAIVEGRLDEALAEFERGGGVFFALVHGVESAHRIVNTFPESLRASSEQLILADVINTMKSGNFSHAKFLLTQHFGPAAERLETIGLPGAFSHGAFSHDFACCRLVIAVCDEEPIGEDTLSMVFRVVEALPEGASMQKGMLYNVALDAFFRRRRWTTAEETARRSKYHFNNARAMLPAFYIDLYFALIELAHGNLALVEGRLDEARAALANAAQSSRNDLHLLEALQHICDYERGDPAPLAQFLLGEMEQNVFEEVWPSIAWPIIDFGSLAIATAVTLSAARAYIDRWRLQQWQSRRFANTVALAEVDVLQVHGRWHEADEILIELTRGNGTDYLRTALPTLAEMFDTEQVSFAMKWCRSLLESEPDSKLLAQALEALALNPNLTLRERMTILIWTAQSSAERQDWEALRVAMGQLAALVHSTLIVAVFREQREVLGRIIADRDVVRRLSSSAKIAAFIRAYRHLAEEPMQTGSDDGLTRQERRMIHLLAEDVQNKLIARRLGLSVPTVRFHLRNLYRKLGAADRGEAIRIAVARGILSE